jgi:hypothetical protein
MLIPEHWKHERNLAVLFASSEVVDGLHSNQCDPKIVLGLKSVNRVRKTM